ncbi:DUF2066 domain-containing protein [Ferrimonas balearica]|uniref:DUF2066 domain-containing protein n=1 Tax=Ferrimonas balearica TaxID=44012 RepID=UPI001C99A6B0|nr:DUF2066 domain-containing protein [Ferrimonas balearica]MBY5990933.1 DUF2066 domain-containing protein [Ferrimonas balearica]
MRRPTVRTILMLALWLPLTAMAAQVDNLYRGEVEVASRSNGDRQSATRDALAQVLVRVTGDAAILERPEAQSLTRQANNLLLSYGYQSGPPLKLEVLFDQNRIDAQLQQARLPIWGAQRPQTLIWLATEQEGERLMLSDGTEAVEPLTADAQRRGLPLMLPLMDLEDTMVVSLNDVWGNFVGPIAQASERYSPDFFLSGRVSPDGNQWRYQMSLFNPQGESEFGIRRALVRRDGVAESQDAAVSAMLADLAQYYAQRYAAVAGDQDSQSQLVFELAGGIEQLVALERYLRSLTPVRDLTIHSVMGREITFDLELIGGIREVEQLLSLEPRVTLVEVEPGFAQDLGDQPRYLWQDR